MDLIVSLQTGKGRQSQRLVYAGALLLLLGGCLLAVCTVYSGLLGLGHLGYRRYTQHAQSGPSSRCDPAACQLPACLCSGAAVPGGLDARLVPQAVALGVQGVVDEATYVGARTLLANRSTPSGCPARATFFVSHVQPAAPDVGDVLPGGGRLVGKLRCTNYFRVQLLRSQGHEIAASGLTHRLPPRWWSANATYMDWVEEAAGVRETLRAFASIVESDVVGFRAPFLEQGGDAQFQALYDLNFKYEASLTASRDSTGRDPPLWPYTLDYRSTQDCGAHLCPINSFPGLWVLPQPEYGAINGRPVFHISERLRAGHGQVYRLLLRSFHRHYNFNRAPFVVSLSSSCFSGTGRAVAVLREVEQFLDHLAAYKDVYLVPVSKVIAWLRRPTILEDIAHFPPWQCRDGEALPPACSEEDVTVCYYDEANALISGLMPVFANANIFKKLVSCVAPCPPFFPWFGNPNGQ
ncbi:LOW QUALITY PROTEIN: chitin deacetylase 7-like [Lampetra planeri]